MPDIDDLISDARRSLLLQREAFCARIDAAQEYLSIADDLLARGDLGSARLLAMAAARCEDDATGDRRACQPLVDALEPERP